MPDLFPPGSPVMFSARRGDGSIVQQMGVVVPYARHPHPTSYVLVKTTYATVEVKVDEVSGVEFERRLPATSCENDDHAFAGQCDDECAWLVNAMMGDGYSEPMVYSDYLGGTSSTDVSGCHGGPQQAAYVAHLDPAAKAVQTIYLHDPGCECRRPACPETIAENAWLASPEGQDWQARWLDSRAAVM